MDTKIFDPLSRVVAQRRPQWKFIIEDELVRILTSQFVVDWKIVVEMITTNTDYEIQDVTTHAQFGIVIAVRYVGGK